MRPRFARGARVGKSITVESSPEECYRFWRNLENLPRFMNHLNSVVVFSGRRSRWAARTIGGATVRWDTEIVRDTPNRMIGWRSLPGSMVDTAGSVRFEGAPGGRRTEVRVKLKYLPPAGEIGALLAELFAKSPSRQIEQNLTRFKMIVEGKKPKAEEVDIVSPGSLPASDPPASW